MGKPKYEVGNLFASHGTCWDDSCFSIAYIGTFEGRRCSALFTSVRDSSHLMYQIISYEMIGAGCKENRERRDKSELKSIPLAELLPQLKGRSVKDLYRVMGTPNLSYGSDNLEKSTYYLDEEPPKTRALREKNLKETPKCGFTVNISSPGNVVLDYQFSWWQEDCVFWYYPPLFVP